MFIYTAKAFQKIHYLKIKEHELHTCINNGKIISDTDDTYKVQFGNIFLRYKNADEEKIILDVYKREI